MVFFNCTFLYDSFFKSLTILNHDLYLLLISVANTFLYTVKESYMAHNSLELKLPSWSSPPF